jgi:hypothetical protein
MVKKAAHRTVALLLLTSPCASFISRLHLVSPTFSTSRACRAAFVASTTSRSPAPPTDAVSPLSFRPPTYLLAENASFDGSEGAGRKSDEADTNSVASTNDHAAVINRHDRLPKAYMIAKYLLAATSLLIFVTPDRSFRILLRQQWSGGAGYACAAALCDILQSAHAQGRQSSDTYKRLHLAVALFSLTSLTAIPGEAGFFRLNQQGPVLSLLTAVRSIGALVALWGWKASIQKTHVIQELRGGIVNTLKGLRVRDGKKALTYRNSFLIVLGAALSSFFQGRFLRSYQKEFLKTNFQISLQWSAVARLAMVAVMIYTLKDAAERDRLAGTTFIQLNVLVGLVAVVAGLGQAAYPVTTAARNGALFFLCSVLFFVKAFQGQTSKRLKLPKGQQ